MHKNKNSLNHKRDMQKLVIQNHVKIVEEMDIIQKIAMLVIMNQNKNYFCVLIVIDQVTLRTNANFKIRSTIILFFLKSDLY